MVDEKPPAGAGQSPDQQLPQMVKVRGARPGAAVFENTPAPARGLPDERYRTRRVPRRPAPAPRNARRARRPLLDRNNVLQRGVYRKRPVSCWARWRAWLAGCRVAWKKVHPRATRSSPDRRGGAARAPPMSAPPGRRGRPPGKLICAQQPSTSVVAWPRRFSAPRRPSRDGSSICRAFATCARRSP